MLSTLIKKELLNNLLNSRILISYAVIFILIVFSVVSRGVQYQETGKTFQANQARFTEDFKKRQTNSWWEYDVQIPPRILSIFCEGFNAAISRPFHVEITHPGNRPLGEYAYTSPLLEIFKAYDLVFIIGYILSLLAIFISYDAVVGEREGQTLRLVLSNPLSRSAVILGKFIGGYLSIIIPYLFSLLTGLLVLQLVAGVPLSANDYMLLMIFIALSLLFLALVFLVSLFYSIVFRNSLYSLFAALLTWIVLAFVAPFLAVQTGIKCVPASLFSDYAQAISRIRIEEGNQARKESEQYFKNNNEDEARNLERRAWRRAHGRMGERWTVELANYKNALKRQMRFMVNLARFSPIASFVVCSSNLTQTGMEPYLHAENWKEVLDETNIKVYNVEYFAWEERNFFNAPGGAEEWEMKRFPDRPFNINLLPSRDYPGLGLAETIRITLPDMLILFLESVVLFMACFYLFVRRGEV